MILSVNVSVAPMRCIWTLLVVLAGVVVVVTSGPPSVMVVTNDGSSVRDDCTLDGVFLDVETSFPSCRCLVKVAAAITIRRN